MHLVCDIYKGNKKEGMYLYVAQSEGLTKVPASLLERFGEVTPVMRLLLGSDKKLAQADVEKVISDIQEQGFYLQLPPQPAILSTDLATNDKLSVCL
jgi:uncharacterized protein YcgL (UPF0745 family)